MTLKQKIEELEALKERFMDADLTGDDYDFTASNYEELISIAEKLFLTNSHLIDAVKEAESIISCARHGEVDEMLDAMEDWLSKYNGGE